MRGNTNILIAVPIFNEERYVEPVLREIRKYARVSALAAKVNVRVLVVDDGSTDSTPAILRSLADRGQLDLLQHPENRGYGQSLIDAFNFAAENQYDWVITMDCDEQHEPCRIPIFVDECLRADQGGADIISGSRYLAKSSVEADLPPEDRRSINRTMTDLLNSILNLKLTDSFCGFKAHRVSAMQKLNLNIPGYAFPMQFWVQAVNAGLQITEIPVRLIYKDATRHFGGLLDDPSLRLQHYLEVFSQELRALRITGAPLVPTIETMSSCCCRS